MLPLFPFWAYVQSITDKKERVKGINFNSLVLTYFIHYFHSHFPTPIQLST